MTKLPQDQERPLALADLWRLIRRKWRPIALWAVACGALAAWVALSRPLTYHAEGTFRDKGKTGGFNQGRDGVLTALLTGVGGGSPDQDTVSLFKSRRLMEPTIRQMGLQVAMVEKSSPWRPFGMFLDNLCLEKAYFTGNTCALFADTGQLVSARDVHFVGETPINFQLFFDDDERYRVEDSDGQVIAQGSLGVPCQAGPVIWTLDQVLPESLTGRTYAITVSPLASTSKRLAGALKIKPAEEREKVLKLTFKFPDRLVATEFVNRLMAAYQEFLLGENKRMADVQLAYLRDRQQASMQELQAYMAEQADNLTSDLTKTGIFDTQKELEFLLTGRQKCSAKVIENEFDFRRFKRWSLEQPGNFRVLTAIDGLPELVTNSLEHISELEQQRDTLEVALQYVPQSNQDQSRAHMDRQLDELQQVRQRGQEAEILLAVMHTSAPIAGELLARATPSTAAWLQRMQDLKAQMNVAQPQERAQMEQQWQMLRDTFVTYLENQQRLCQVYERVVQERVAHQHNPDRELQGIDLDTANHIYITLNQQQNETESTMRQNHFVLAELADPLFEISSVGGTLLDPVSSNIVAAASKIVLSLKDSDNRSEREKVRLREELAQQRAFLKAHLEQTNQLLALRVDFLKEKIRGLQKVLLDLTQQQISVCTKHLNDYLAAKLDHLDTERSLLNETQRELRQQMALLPTRWVAERIVLHQLNLNMALVQEVSKLVESKNIANNLETVQASALDQAIPPNLPQRPQLLLFAILGAVLGGALAVGGVVLNGLRQGLAASPENLRLAGQRIAGYLGGGEKEQLEALRRLTAQLCVGGEPDVLLLMTGRGPDYSSKLASLLSKRGGKVLRVKKGKVLRVMVGFDRDGPPGLLQFFEGQAAKPAIQKKEDYDEITSGGLSPYRSEFISSARFQALLQVLRRRYQTILLVSPVHPDSAEAENLAAHFDHMAITLAGERLEDLEPLLRVPHCTFLFTH